MVERLHFIGAGAGVGAGAGEKNSRNQSKTDRLRNTIYVLPCLSDLKKICECYSVSMVAKLLRFTVPVPYVEVPVQSQKVLFVSKAL